MSQRILAQHAFIEPDAMTIAQRVEPLVREPVDRIVNNVDSPIPLMVAALAVETSLTVVHLYELGVVRPILAAVAGVLR